MLNGGRFVETLSRLGYPNASTLKGSEFDWLFDAAPDNLHLLRVFCHRLSRSNVLTPGEVEAFRVLRDSGKPILDESMLGDLLKTCGPSDGSSLPSLFADEDVSVEELKAEVQALRKERQLKLGRLKKLQVLVASRGADSSVACALVEEGGDAAKNASAALTVENAAVNMALEALAKEVTKLAQFFQTEAVERNDDSAQSGLASLLCQLPLEPYLRQEEQNTKALSAYTQRQFFQGILDMVETSTLQLMDLSCVSERQEEEDDQKVVEGRRKEMAQLQWAHIVAQHQLLKEQAEEHGGQALKNWLSEQLRNGSQPIDPLKASWREPALRSELLSIQSDLEALLREPVRLALRDGARLLNVPVVRGDLALQIARQNYYTGRQTEVRDQLLRQKASFEVLRLAQDAELRSGRSTVGQLEEIIQRLEGGARTAAQRANVLIQPELTQGPSLGPNAELQVISSKDGALSRLLNVLELGKLPDCKDPLLTYGRLEADARALQEELLSVRESVGRVAQERRYGGARLERDRAALERSAYSGLVQPLLRQQVRAVGPAQELCPNAQDLSVALTELEEKQKNLYKHLQDIVGDLRTKRAQLDKSATLRRERELYVYFHLDPTLLSKAVQDMEARTGVM